MLERVTFEAHLSQSDAALGVSYTVKNGGESDIGLFNRLRMIFTDGGMELPPEAVFVDIEGSHLLLMKMALPVPAGVNVTAYIPPHVTRVEPGKQFSETFAVPLPARVRQPFKRALLRGDVVPARPLAARTCELRIGAFPIDPDVRLVPDRPAIPEALVVSPPGSALRQQQVLSARFELQGEVTVLDYEGYPWP